jgi:RNA ligase (TIGR02306 family)
MRQLVTIQQITQLSPIANADNLELATVKGWHCVVRKGEFEEGESVAYFEIDSLLPDTDKRYDSFQSRGKKTVLLENGEEVSGHVVRTMRLRGALSQGLIMPLSEVLLDHSKVGDDITAVAAVVKYEPPLPVTGGAIIGQFDATWAPKTDAVRIQNLGEIYPILQEEQHRFEVSVKVDGTSRTFVNDGSRIRIFQRNFEITDKDSAFAVFESQGLLDSLGKNMAIQAEYAGPGINGNRQKLRQPRLFVFAVWDHGVKLRRNQWSQACLDNAAPSISLELPENLQGAIDLIDGLRGNITKDVLDEGVVFSIPSEVDLPFAVESRLDRNLNFKIISNTYLAKEK